MADGTRSHTSDETLKKLDSTVQAQQSAIVENHEALSQIMVDLQTGFLLSTCPSPPHPLPHASPILALQTPTFHSSHPLTTHHEYSNSHFHASMATTITNGSKSVSDFLAFTPHQISKGFAHLLPHGRRSFKPIHLAQHRHFVSTLALAGLSVPLVLPFWQAAQQRQPHFILSNPTNVHRHGLHTRIRGPLQPCLWVLPTLPSPNLSSQPQAKAWMRGLILSTHLQSWKPRLWAHDMKTSLTIPR